MYSEFGSTNKSLPTARPTDGDVDPPPIPMRNRRVKFVDDSRSEKEESKPIPEKGYYLNCLKLIIELI